MKKSHPLLDINNLSVPSDAESARFAEELARRPREIVFVTRDARGAAALRDWGVLAVARPEGGLWDSEALRPLMSRELVVVLDRQDPKNAWARPVVRALTGVTARVTDLLLTGPPGAAPAFDVEEAVRQWRLGGFPPQPLLDSARNRLGGPVKPRLKKEEWPALRYGTAPGALEFRSELLPPAVSRFVRGVGSATGCEDDFAGVAALVAAGAAMGPGAALRLKPGYEVVPALHGVLVGRPGTGKTAALKVVLEPLGDELGGGRLTVADNVDWAHHAFRLPHEFPAFCGGLSPQALAGWRRGGQRHPSTDRLLFAFPEFRHPLRWSYDGMEEDVAEGWAAVVGRLRAFAPEGTPRMVELSAEARESWRAWYDGRVNEIVEPTFDEGLFGVERALCDRAARLALVLHGLEWACQAEPGPVPELSQETLGRAIALWGYFWSHHRRARWTMGGELGSRIGRAIIDWAMRTGREWFTIRDLTSGLRWLAGRTDEPETALAELERRHAIRRRPCDPSEPKPGRRPSPCYDLHPDLVNVG